MSNIYYRVDNGYFYKIITSSKKIYKITIKEVETIDYDSHYELVKSFTPLKKNDWNSMQNSFFISRHFEWVYEGVCFTTTDKRIQYTTPTGSFTPTALVFHNGLVWEAYYSSNYFPRIQLTAKVKRTNKETGEVTIVQKSKWTDEKYLRAFEKVPESKQRALKIKEIFNDCFDL